jgi:uncharacterized protein YndB with AHSA1/START domain
VDHVPATLRDLRSIHIDAPPEKVFDYLADPDHFIAGLAAGHQARIVDMHRAADGSVDSFECTYDEVGRVKSMTMTPEQLVPDRRIAYRSSAGPVHVFTLEPDAGGTTLSYGWDGPRLRKMLGAVFTHTDRDIERALAVHKQGIEALP